MTLARPDVALTFDGTRLTAAEAALAGLEVELGMGQAHDRFRATLASSSPFTSATTGAAAVVELGYAGALETVLTGTITAVRSRQWGVVVEGLAATLALSRARIGRSYVSQSAGDIVSDLVTAAQGTIGDVSGSLQLAAYHVDEGRSVWTHVGALARLAGCETSADGQGALNFRPPKTGSPSQSFRSGAELIAWAVGPRDNNAPTVAVVPFGAASEQGASHWHVILRAPDGGPPSNATLVPGSLRDRDGAQTYAQALSDARSRRATSGSVVVAGAATVRPGDVVTLQDVPSPGGNQVRVTAAVHRVDGATGFHTLMQVEGMV